MNKQILQIIFIVTIAALGSLSAVAQKSQPKKLREVKIYVLQYDDAENPTGLVAVKRQVDAAVPLHSTLNELINGVTDDEERENMRRFLLGFESYSVSLKKDKTAQVNFSTEYGFEWGEPLRTYFSEAVEKTFLQFPEVKKVKICVDGKADYWRNDVLKHKKCRP